MVSLLRETMEAVLLLIDDLFVADLNMADLDIAGRSLVTAPRRLVIRPCVIGLMTMGRRALLNDDA